MIAVPVPITSGLPTKMAERLRQHAYDARGSLFHRDAASFTSGNLSILCMVYVEQFLPDAGNL